MHTYVAPGSRTININVTVNGLIVLIAQSTATVTDADFLLGIVADHVKAGQSFNGIIANLEDLNLASGKVSDFTAVIDWGDGNKTIGWVLQTTVRLKAV